MTVVIDSELTLGLFYLVSKIIFAFLLTRDCRFVYCLLLIVDLSLTTVLFCFILSLTTKFYFDPQSGKSKDIINSDTLTLPPT